MAGSRVLRFALIGALLGLLPTLPSAARYFRYIPYDSSPGITAARLAWVMLKSALPGIVVSAVLGAAVGILVSRRPRSKDVAGTNEKWLGERRTFLLIAGTSITAVLFWYTPHFMLYPSLGVTLAWVISRRAGWTNAGAILFLGGLMGNLVHLWSGKLFLLAFLGTYATNSVELGLIVIILFPTLQALGPTLLLMGVTPPSPSNPVTA
jgi:hypothetical protein